VRGKQSSENLVQSSESAPRRKRGQPVPGAMLERIQILAVQGLPPPRIVDVLEREFDPAAVPDVRTVRNHAAKMLKRLGLVQAVASRRGDDAPWVPRPPGPAGDVVVGPARGDPGDGDRAVLDVLAAAAARGLAWPDRATARWWAWVRERAPDLPAEDVPDLAALWRARHARGESTRDLTLFVACRPWHGAGAFAAYLDALVATGEPLYPWWAGFPAVAGAWLARCATALLRLLRSAWRVHDAVRGLWEVHDAARGLAAARGEGTRAGAELTAAAEAARAGAAAARAEAAAWGAWLTPWCDRLRAALIVLHDGTWEGKGKANWRVRTRGGGDGATDAAPPPPPPPPPPQAAGDVLPMPEGRDERRRAQMGLVHNATVALLWALRAVQDWDTQGLPPARRLMETWGAPTEATAPAEPAAAAGSVSEAEGTAPGLGAEPWEQVPPDRLADPGQAGADGADWDRLLALIRAVVEQVPVASEIDGEGTR
jgi:hypothetical protein